MATISTSSLARNKISFKPVFMVLNLEISSIYRKEVESFQAHRKTSEQSQAIERIVSQN